MDLLNALEVETWIAIAAATTSVIGAIVSYLVASRQTRINVESLKFANDTAVIAWANRVVSVMSEAHEFALAEAEGDGAAYQRRRVTFLHVLSSLVDEGRWFFPNVGEKAGDTNVEGAYRGHRQPILDFIVAAYNAVADQEPAQAAATLLQQKRAFVSEVQRAVDPLRRQWIMERFRKF